MPTLLSTFNALTGEIKLRYEEPFVTEGLNAAKAVIVPRGTHRGFRLGPSLSASTVAIVADPTWNDHVAQYLTTDQNDPLGYGHTLTIRRVGGNFGVSLSTLLNTVVVIAIHAAYGLGNATTAVLNAYTLTEFNSLLPDQQEELIVLGMVTVPRTSSVIPAANIVHSTRIFAGNEIGQDAVPFLRVADDPAFSQVGYPLATPISGVDGMTWFLQSSSGLVGTWVQSGTSGNQLNLAVTSTSLQTFDFHPRSAVLTVQSGQVLRVRLDLKALEVPGSGSIQIQPVYEDILGETISTLDTYTIPIAGIDSSFRTIDQDFTVPPNAVYITKIRLFSSDVSYGTTGNVLLVEAFQIWLETLGTLNELDGGMRPARMTLPTLRMPSPVKVNSPSDPIFTNPGNSTVIFKRADNLDSSADPAPTLFTKGTMSAGSSVTGINRDGVDGQASGTGNGGTFLADAGGTGAGAVGVGAGGTAPSAGTVAGTGLFGQGGSGSQNGVAGQGTGGGPGVGGTGGPTAGSADSSGSCGVYGQGGTGGSYGVFGRGTANFAGIFGVGGGTGDGGDFFGGSGGGAGVSGTGAGGTPTVAGVGAAGGVFTGGSGNNNGVIGQAVGGAPGVVGVGGATASSNSSGGYFQGGTGGGPGVRAVATGTNSGGLFTGGPSGARGLQATAATGNYDGVDGIGSGSGAGLGGEGGSSGGAGIFARGGTGGNGGTFVGGVGGQGLLATGGTGGSGVVGNGGGGGAGGSFTGGPTGMGVVGGAGTGSGMAGVVGFGDGAGAGGAFTAGVGSGAGATGQGGTLTSGAGNGGAGLLGTGGAKLITGADGAGVGGIGGGLSGIGVVGDGAPGGNGQGVQGNATGSATGGFFRGGSSGGVGLVAVSGGSGAQAISAEGGGIYCDTNAPSTPGANQLYANSICKAHGCFSTNGAGGFTLNPGALNIGNIDITTLGAGGEAIITFATPMADAGYTVVTVGNVTDVHGSIIPVLVQPGGTAKKSTSFNLVAYGVNLTTDQVYDLSFAVFGRQ